MLYLLLGGWHVAPHCAFVHWVPRARSQHRRLLYLSPLPSCLPYFLSYSVVSATKQDEAFRVFFFSYFCFLLFLLVKWCVEGERGWAFPSLSTVPLPSMRRQSGLHLPLLSVFFFLLSVSTPFFSFPCYSSRTKSARHFLFPLSLYMRRGKRPVSVYASAAASSVTPQHYFFFPLFIYFLPGFSVSLFFPPLWTVWRCPIHLPLFLAASLLPFLLFTPHLQSAPDEWRKREERTGSGERRKNGERGCWGNFFSHNRIQLLWLIRSRQDDKRNTKLNEGKSCWATGSIPCFLFLFFFLVHVDILVDWNPPKHFSLNCFSLKYFTSCSS